MTKAASNNHSKPRSAKAKRETVHITIDSKLLDTIRSQANAEKRSMSAQFALLVERSIQQQQA
jgi:hypothetical protein